MVIKKIAFLFLSISSVYASEEFKQITPSDFNDSAKKKLEDSIETWVSMANEMNIPTDKGLAKLFLEMRNEGVEKLIHNEEALKKTNKYFCDFLSSPTAQTIKNLTVLQPDGQGNYSFNSAKEVVPDLRSVLFQYELCNILNKDGALWNMPSNSHLVIGFLMPSNEKAKLILKLNEDNETLSPDAIRGQGLLTAYYSQQKN